MTPEGWTDATMGDCLNLLTDYTANGSFASLKENVTYYSEPNHAVLVRTTDLKKKHFRPERFTDLVGYEYLKKSALFPGDIVIANVGSAGEAFRVPEYAHPMTLAPNMYLVRFKDDIDTRFIFQVMTSGAFKNELIRNTASTTLKAINKTNFRSIPVLLPPLPEQRKIAAILSSVDEVIDKTEAVIEQLQVVKKAMMQELLTRGLPGRHTRFKPLDQDWRLGRVAQGLGEIPESWDLVLIGSVARLESGHTPSRRKPEYWDGDIPWVSLHDTKRLDVPVINDTVQTVSELGIANSSARLLPAGTVVFSRTATVGKSGVLGREMATSQDFANYVCGDRLHNRYLMHLFRHMQPEWKRLMAGSTHQTIYMPTFRDLQILLPPIDEQERVAEVADGFDARLSAEAGIIAELRGVKSALLSVLLTGELRVTPDEPSA